MCMNCLQLVLTKSARSGKSDQPWVTLLIRRLSSKKQCLYNCAKRSGLLDDWKEYHAAKKLMQRECRQAHNRFLCEIFDPDSNRGYKNLWSYVKCKRHDQVAIFPLVVNNSTISESQEKANVINQQFSSVFTDENVSTLPDLAFSPYNSIVT